MSMDIIDQAVYDLIHGYPKGAPALSAALLSKYGFSVAPGTLMNKANPEQPHHLTVREADLIQRIQGKYYLLHASAHQLNHSAVWLGDYSNTSDVEFLNTYTTLHAALGELAGVINRAFTDNIITRNEVREVRTRGMAVIRALLEMESRIRALCSERAVFDDE